MKTLIGLTFLSFLIQTGNPKLDQDVIFLKAAQEKAPPGESFEVITEKNMLKAKDVLRKYWKSNEVDTTWANFNRQYMVYNSNQAGQVVVIGGACLEKSADYFEKVLCLGFAADKCYYMAYINLKKKKLVNFKWNTYSK